MTADFLRLRILLLALAGWISRHQQDVIEYLVEENRVLKEQVRGRCLRLTDDQRRRLAAKGKVLGRSVLAAVVTIVTPDTILRWHRQLIARKWTYPIKQECLSRMILFGERSLLRCLREFTAYYHAERNHQGIGNELIDGGELVATGPVECQERLGGLLKYNLRGA